uniref:Uncharacterized protein n=1 Tax=Chelonoidis abingdonii TaxID=106734 RepID=A0A8C0FXT7_CHEAB
MAAEIHARPQSSRPVLLSKVEGHQDAVSAALLIPQEDGLITASEDRWFIPKHCTFFKVQNVF